MNNSFCLIREKRKNESIAKSIFLLCTKITVQHVRYHLQGYGYLMGKTRRKISTWPWPTGTHLLHSQKKGGCYKVYCWNPSSLLKVPTWTFDYEVYKKGRGMGNKASSQLAWWTMWGLPTWVKPWRRKTKNIQTQQLHLSVTPTFFLIIIVTK